MAKKKKNPLFFHWLVDPFKGFWSPIIKQWAATAIRDALLESVKDRMTVTPEEIVGVKLPKSLIWPKPKTETVEQYYLAHQIKAGEENAVAAGVAAGTTLASAYSLGVIGDAIDEVWRIPILNAMMNHAVDVHLSDYMVSVKPLIRRHLLSKRTPLLPETYRLAIAASKGIIDLETYYDAMAESGLSRKWADVWRSQNLVYPSLETALSLLRRGEIDEGVFKHWMLRSGYPGLLGGELVKLKSVIPSIADLRTMAVREAFEVKTREEQYAEMAKWAGKMGLAPEWTPRYLKAGYRRMDVGDAARYYLWYHDLPKDYERFLAIADIHPDDQAKVAEVSYSLPTLREMGYGFDTLKYGRDKIYELRRKGGLSIEDANIAADSMVAYRTEAEREAVRREYLYLFVAGKIDEKAFREHLTELTTHPKAIKLWIERGVKQKERKGKPLEVVEPKIVSASEAKWMYVHGLRDEAWYKSKLADLDWDEERVTVAVARARAEIEAAKVEEKVPEYRKLTVTQIRDLWRLEKISSTEVPAFLEAVNFSPEDASRVAELITYVEPVEPRVLELTRTDIRHMLDLKVFTREDTVKAYIELGYPEPVAEVLVLYEVISLLYPDLKSMYSKGWINEETMYNELLATGLDKEKASELMMMTVKYSKPERTAAERDLTKSEIVKGAKAELITPSQAVELLMDLGYENWEAWYILAINKVVAAGDPEGYWEMKRVTEAYKRSQGLPSKTVPDELLMLEAQVKRKKEEVADLRDADAPDAVLSEALADLGVLEARYRKVMVEWEKLPAK